MHGGRARAGGLFRTQRQAKGHESLPPPTPRQRPGASPGKCRCTLRGRGVVRLGASLGAAAARLTTTRQQTPENEKRGRSDCRLPTLRNPNRSPQVCLPPDCFWAGSRLAPGSLRLAPKRFGAPRGQWSVCCCSLRRSARPPLPFARRPGAGHPTLLLLPAPSNWFRHAWSGAAGVAANFCCSLFTKQPNDGQLTVKSAICEFAAVKQQDGKQGRRWEEESSRSEDRVGGRGVLNLHSGRARTACSSNLKG